MPGNAVQVFRGRNLLWHALAIALTAIFVFSGVDWAYYQFFHNSPLGLILFSSAYVGFLVPPFVPILVYLFGIFLRKAKVAVAGLALGQGAILGYLVSIFYKALTGRAHPTFPVSVLGDITREFHFGILRGGVFWGWPSSHTAVAFGMAFALIALFPKNKMIKFFALAYALFIGVGISFTIHWFSDFAAGAILGALAGTIVGRSYRNLLWMG